MTRAGTRSTIYVLHVVPGLEDIAAAEVVEHCTGSAVLHTLRRFDERTSLLLVSYGGTPADLLELRTVEDVFVLLVDRQQIPADRAGLATVRAALATESSAEAAVALALRIRPRRRGRTTIRVITRKAGEHTFRRVDLQRATEQALLGRFPNWRTVEDDAQLEVWVQLVNDRLVVGLRLSDVAMRGRTYRTTSLPAALKPTVAAAMVRLSAPQADDVFLDPMCGSGTIVIERALADRYRLLLAGDLDPAAVQATRDNIGPRYKPIEIGQWDARRLPLDAGSISTLVTNLPFGVRIGSREENRALYPALMNEWRRILQTNGRLVVLTSERGLMAQTLQRHPALTEERRLSVLVRGLPATIFVCRHSATSVRSSDADA